MELLLKRLYKKEMYTIGKLYVDGKFFSDTLEDKVRDLDSEKKVWGQTAIPAGEYKVVFNWSPKFSRNMPRLLNVPAFNGILIHAGNTAIDTAGCILVGFNRRKGRLEDSRNTSDKLNVLIEDAQRNGEPVVIKIV